MAERPAAQGTPVGLTNRISGERYVFYEDNDALRWETYVARNGDGPPEHSHPRQEERFLVRSSVMGARVGGRDATLRKGEELAVPPRASHKVWNAGQGELHATVEMRPAAPRFRAFLEAGAALPQGPLGLLEGARLLHEYRDVILPASPPEPVRRVVFPALAVSAELVRVLDRRHAGRDRSPGEARGPARIYRLTAVRRLVNRAMAAGLRFGVGPRATYLLTTRGRKSGEPRTTPVTLLEEGDGGRRRWLVAPYGEVNWVKNARAAGRVTLSRGHRSETVAVEELNPQEAAPVLKEYAKRVPIVRPYFDADPDSPVEAFAAEARRHPVFRLTDFRAADGSAA